jgi:hypothetical protein
VEGWRLTAWAMSRPTSNLAQFYLVYVIWHVSSACSRAACNWISCSRSLNGLKVFVLFGTCAWGKLCLNLWRHFLWHRYLVRRPASVRHTQCCTAVDISTADWLTSRLLGVGGSLTPVSSMR